MTLVMPEVRELGPINPRINYWLEELETAKIERTLYGIEEETSVSNNSKMHAPLHSVNARKIILLGKYSRIKIF